METSQRTYESSHAWLTFQLDLSAAEHTLWLLLGEARSKIEHLSGALLKPDVAARLHFVFLAKGAHATTAIEGNTLTEEQAQQLLDGTLRLPQSQEYLAREVENILNAFNTISTELVTGASRDLTPEVIERYNAMVLDGLDVEPEVVPGELRRHPVTVGRYRGAPAEDCDYLLHRLCEWLNGSGFKHPPEEPDLRLPFAILKAVAAHLYLAWIHPFGDGNGRTARLMEHQILLAAGVPTPATHLLSNHYNLTRADYYRWLAEASSGTAGTLGFVRYALRGFVDGLAEQLGQVREQQFDDRWEQYVYEAFGDTKSPSQIRQRQLVLDLSHATQPVVRGKLRELSPAIAAAYAKKTTKTLSRDINSLKARNLIRLERFRDKNERLRVGWVPNREIILAFLPLSAAQSEQTE
jgi:Fic family protein